MPLSASWLTSHPGEKTPAASSERNDSRRKKSDVGIGLLEWASGKPTIAVTVSSDLLNGLSGICRLAGNR